MMQKQINDDILELEIHENPSPDITTQNGVRARIGKFIRWNLKLQIVHRLSKVVSEQSSNETILAEIHDGMELGQDSFDT